MNKGKILVTGGAGYIGSHAVLELCSAGFEPVIVDDLSRSSSKMIDGLSSILGRQPLFHQVDCTDKEALREVFAQHAFTCVMHFAAFKSVGESVSEPLLYYRNNLDSLVCVLDLMQDFDVKSMIFSSSCTVYGQPDNIPVNETAPFKRAESPYGATKQMCERILEDVSARGLGVISLRYFNPIGAHPSALIGELPIGIPNNLVPYVTQTAAGIRPMLTIFGADYATPDGTCIRDFIHVSDVAKAHVKALEYILAQPLPHHRAINLGTGVGVSVLELVKKFILVNGVQLPYQIGPRREGDVVQVYADPSLAQELLQWKPGYSLEEALRTAWAWELKLRKTT